MIDSHAHLSSDEVYADVDAVLERAHQAGVAAIINICTDPSTLERGLRISERYNWVFNVASTTPHDVATEGVSAFETMAEAARSGSLVAIGETGLDYYYAHSPRDLQNEFLRHYLDLARACKLPVVIHCREAFQDLFKVLNDYPDVLGVLHCFTGTLEEAQELVKRNWFISLSGIVTFKKSIALQEVARWIPLANLFIETDTPYLAPQRHRGKPNEPAFIRETAEMVATLKNKPVQDIIDATTKNCCAFYGLDRTTSGEISRSIRSSPRS